jgi:hypothetical protein
MEFVKLALRSNGNGYTYKGSSSIRMDIIGMFLATDVGNYGQSFKEWIMDTTQTATASNVTCLEKKAGDIFLSDLYSAEKKPTEIGISFNDLIQLLDNWKEKVCEKKPKEVIIKYENGQFFIETKD